MKKYAFVLAAMICLSSTVALAQLSFGVGGGGGFGGGMGGLGVGLGDRDIIRISPDSRTKLHDYLVEQYDEECGPKAKDASDDCDDTKALYASSNLPEKNSEPVPKDVLHELGFVPPGTEYVQAGYVIYLVRLPRRIILDSVSLDGKDNGLTKFFNKQD